jgi:hypothetical protein
LRRSIDDVGYGCSTETGSDAGKVFLRASSSAEASRALSVKWAGSPPN